jgi:hypothetical protein
MRKIASTLRMLLASKRATNVRWYCLVWTVTDSDRSITEFCSMHDRRSYTFCIDQRPDYSRCLRAKEQQIFVEHYKVWPPGNYVTIIILIESVQRAFTKRIPALSHLPYKERLKQTGLLSLEHRRVITDLCMLHKIIYGFVSFNVELNFNRNNTRGHSMKLFQFKSRTNIRLNYFINRSIRVWNSLPDELVILRNTKTFKRELKNCQLLINSLCFAWFYILMFLCFLVWSLIYWDTVFYRMNDIWYYLYMWGDA